MFKRFRLTRRRSATPTRSSVSGLQKVSTTTNIKRTFTGRSPSPQRTRTPLSKSPKICCQMWKLSSHDSKWQRPLCEPKISEEKNMSVYFYHHRKSWSSPSELTHNTMIMMMITVRSLYLMARQQNSLAVNPALAVTFVLGKWEWMSPNRESFF